ncbi:MAG: TRAP transporter substrate-binding protein DctP [Lentisphaerae bacterium]|jgi:TRAP-type transport system periplasmic protein|nr:TRAP transporter substrate-binding protein DctP [Lentisphaerota bacterium]MBT4816036.1 TRAP transporter substrate-binding protein DctP [Lentisphaerota bacterium]MBT5606860.1 TRAP transporter substrate-binding protein DctP [Lentisphaerota bacterium]MBT7059007.1 TRAP transporter substrate-binding protein DctP [Lentisphaerota bacterium]MBT7843579.1 TRAP transporter substrate-binding protein DctP [Lentisphaerota bacterium]
MTPHGQLRPLGATGAFGLRLALLGLAMLSISSHAKNYRLKFAMLAPDRSVWGKHFKAISRDLAARTDGRVKLKVYAGGVQGDEATMVRKMRIGQLHGAGFLAKGINAVCPDSTVLSIPLLFRTEAEAIHCLTALDPHLRKQAEKQGYHIIGWTNQGFAYLFGRDDVRDIASLRRAKPWVPSDDVFGQALFDACDVSPIPAQVSDVLTGLQSGLIRTVFTPPIGMIAMQWHTRASYHLDLGLFYSFGAVVITNKQWKKLPDDVRGIVETVFTKHVAALNKGIGDQNAEALQVLGKSITTVTPTPRALAEFEELNRDLVKRLSKKTFSEEALQILQDALREFRDKAPAP